MSFSYILPVALFTITMSITPGPNNIMLTASGANFGFRRTLPHLLGIWFGFLLIMAVSAFGLKEIFDSFPAIRKALKYAGVAYMLFLAWKIARSGESREAGGSTSPITFLQAALFQIINPKVIMMSFTVMSVYTLEGDRFALSALLVMAVFLLTGFPSTSLWALFGTVIGKKLKSGRNLKIFNCTLSGLTAAVAISLLF